MALIVRPSDRAAAIAGVRRVLADLDPQLGVSPFLTMEDAYATTLARPRLLTGLLSGFAGTALVLALIGIYGVTAYTVRRREREFGIRVALGAHARAITKSVVWETLWVAFAGIAAGVLGALLLSRTLEALLFGVSPADPMVLIASATLLGLAAIVASWIPARGASRGHPAQVLHSE